MAEDQEQDPKFRINWTMSIPNVIAIIGVIASFAYSQAAINGRIDTLQLRQTLLEAKLTDLADEARVERRDIQLQLRELQHSMDKMLGLHTIDNHRSDK